MKLSPKEYAIIKNKCKQSGIEYSLVMQWLDEGKTTIKEIMQGILGYRA